MIIRLVKMTFQKEELGNFLILFDEVKNHIRQFEGCHDLELLQDINDDRVLFTKSIWESEDALDNYRYSELFSTTWKKTKSMFVEKPFAWSTKLISKS